MKRYPKCRYPGEEETKGVFREGDVYVQEKLDGGNGRFMHERHLDEQFQTEDRGLVFGSRNVVYKNDKDVANNFEQCVEYVREQVDPDQVAIEEQERDGEFVFFGEYMVPHTIQDYDWENIPRFIGFDVWNERTERFMHPETARDIFHNLGLEYAPIIEVCDASDWGEGNTRFHNNDGSLTVPESEYGDVRAEGFMFKNPTTEVYAKYVREDFKEKNNKTFNSTGYDPSGAEKLSHEYVTNARIEKQIHKLVNEEGWDYCMEMMEELPEAVIRDMAEEEAGDIFMENSYEVDLHEFRSTVSGRCANVLRKVINQRAIQA